MLAFHQSTHTKPKNVRVKQLAAEAIIDDQTWQTAGFRDASRLHT
jgi:hypothetical protein